MDINNNMSEKVANYLAKTGQSNFDEIKEKMTEIVEDLGSYDASMNESLFTVTENTQLGVDDFKGIIADATGKDVSEVGENAELLFDILNEDSSDTLSADELSIIANDEGTINKFTLWNNVDYFEADSVGSYYQDIVNPGASELAISDDDSSEAVENKLDTVSNDETDSAEEASSTDEAAASEETNAQSSTTTQTQTTTKTDENGNTIVTTTTTTVDEDGDTTVVTTTSITDPEGNTTVTTSTTHVEANDNTDKAADDAEKAEDTGKTDETDGAAATPKAAAPAANNSENKVDFSNKEDAKEFVEKFIDDVHKTPDEVIDWLLDENVISEEQAQQLRDAYSEYSEDDQEEIDALMDLGLTEEQAVNLLDEFGKLDDYGNEIPKEEVTEDGTEVTEDGTEVTEDETEVTEDGTEVIEDGTEAPKDEVPSVNYLQVDPSDETSAAPKEEDEATITDEGAKELARELNLSMKGLGTRENEFENVLYNENLSDADIVKIVSEYNKEYDSLITDIDGDFSGESQKKAMEKVADALLNEAKNGSEDAVKLLAKELNNATAGQSGTAEDFVNKVFEDADSDLIAQIAENYAEYTGKEDANLYDDIKADFSGKVQNELLKKITDAIALHKE